MGKIDFDAIILEIRELYRTMDTAHDFFHAMRVTRMAERIKDNIVEPVDLDKLKLVALLHDADDPKNFPVFEDHATKIMQKYGVDPALSKEVTEEISLISFSKGKRPCSTEGKIVQDAERLDAIGAVGIARTFCFGGKHDIPIYDEEGYCTIQHFYDKLLKLKDLMNFEYSACLAAERTAVMERFLKDFFGEIKG